MLDCRKTINKRLLYVSALSPWMYTSLMVEHHDLNPSLKFWTQLYTPYVKAPLPLERPPRTWPGTTARADSLTLMHPPKLHGTHRRHSTPRLTLLRDRSVHVRRTPKTLPKKTWCRSRRCRRSKLAAATAFTLPLVRPPATLSYHKIVHRFYLPKPPAPCSPHVQRELAQPENP